MAENLDVHFPEKLQFLFAPKRYKVAHGGRGCVHPDTLIDTPNGQIKICDFSGGDVYSYNNGELCITTASKPISYTEEQLYEIGLENSKSIVVTDEHKFLTKTGWKQLKELSITDQIVFSSDKYAYNLLLTNSGDDSLMSLEDVLRLKKILVDCRDGYLKYYHQYDQQPPLVEDSGLMFVPLQGDEARHSYHALLNADDQAFLHKYILSLTLFPRSNWDVPLEWADKSYEDLENCNVLLFFEQLLQKYPFFQQFLLKNILALSDLKPLLQFPVYDNELNQVENSQIILDTLGFGAHDSSFVFSDDRDFIVTNISFIRKHSRQVYWDMYVEKTNCYLSNGIVNHNSGKSYNFAQALILLAAQRPLRVLCTREIQKSIKQSVHLLLSDQIQRLGLGAFFTVLETEIRGMNGSLFMFAGLAQHTVESIKSIEGCDIVWVEEAQTVSKKSWDILIPTIRKDDSEIWVSFNPDLDTDDTYTRFVLNPAPSATVVEMNFGDNPYFPKELEAERLHCMETNPEDYENIWLGKCRSAVTGAIYANEVNAATLHGRICNVPYDPLLKVHAIWDLGWNDSMAILLVQKVRSEIRIIESIEDDHKTLDYYAGLLNSKKYNWGYDFLPHDGRTKDFKTGKSTEELLKAFGRKVKITPNMPIESGIKAARLMFSQCYFDKAHSIRLLECLKRYRRSINPRTNEAGAPLHDTYSHSADAFRYLAVNAESLSNEDRRAPVAAPRWQPYDSGVGY